MSSQGQRSPSQGPRSAQSSQQGSPPEGSQGSGRSRAGSVTRSAGGLPPNNPPRQAAGNPFGQGLGFDPARSQSGGKTAKQEHLTKIAKRFDIPAEAYLDNPSMNRFTKRPGYNQGPGVRPVDLEINQFQLRTFNANTKIHQYDVSINPLPQKNPDTIFKLVWQSKEVQQELAKARCKWLTDGRKLAWAPVLIGRDGELRVKVDLDADRPPEKKRAPFFCIIKKTTEINMAALQAYLGGKISWDNSVLECMNFLDHVIRQYPSENLTAIKRNFYRREMKRMQFDTMIEAVKGVYSSIRLSSHPMTGTTPSLGLNVDVTNTAFWIGGQDLATLMCTYLPANSNKFPKNQLRNGMANPALVAMVLRPEQIRGSRGVSYQMSPEFKTIRKLQKLRFHVPMQKLSKPKQYSVYAIEFGEKYGPEGATANNVKFEYMERMISVRQFFQQKYNYALKYPDLPVIATPKGEYFPAEVCVIPSWQRYPFKLDGEQTSKMIKFAVTRPTERRKDIFDCQAALDWGRDPYLQQYGITFDQQFTKTKGAFIPNPEMEYAGGGKINPGTSGRWDLRGKRFIASNTRPLQSWGIVVLENSVQQPQADGFIKQFKTIYTGHGGRVPANGIVINGSNKDLGVAIADAYNLLKQKNGRCDLLFFVLRFQNAGTYERIKKNCDCRFGILSQVVLSSHVMKNQGQYHSNVAMKVNAKLGGRTNRVAPRPGQKLAFFKERTMQLGVDISHGSPGMQTASIAAMTGSVDPDATKFAACVQTNGSRVEILRKDNVNKFLHTLIPLFAKENGDIPTHIYYFRDGVAEGQFAQVILDEVTTIRAYFERNYKKVPKFTVIIAVKRHHIRFFPRQGDKNGNPLPGTVVERDVTHPFQWDFFLCSHVAIQGTARPVHYHVIMDEANCNPTDLQRMIYHQSYQYARSTTPVSLHPAVYYAHLACDRARAHDNSSVDSGPSSGPKAAEIAADRLSKGLAVTSESLSEMDVASLLGLGGNPNETTDADRDFIKSTMWYI